MKIKELIILLKTLKQEAEVLVSSDEELNTLYKDFEVSTLIDDKINRVVIYGLSGSEVE